MEKLVGRKARALLPHCVGWGSGTPDVIHANEHMDVAVPVAYSSVDNSMMFVNCFDSNMNKFDWDGADGTIADSTVGYLADLPKSEWVYFRFIVTKLASGTAVSFRIAQDAISWENQAVTRSGRLEVEPSRTKSKQIQERRFTTMTSIETDSAFGNGAAVKSSACSLDEPFGRTPVARILRPCTLCRK